jgi:penicillin-binding protein 1C
MAYDPRLPASHQAFEFILQGVAENDTVDWHIDRRGAVRQAGARYLWPLLRGEHTVGATVWRDGQRIASIVEVRFLVR